MKAINNLDFYNTAQELTKEQLLVLVKMYVAFADEKGVRPTMEGFAKWSKQFNGNSKRNAITRRFASTKEKNDGWYNVMKMLGRTTARRPKWSIDEILEATKQLYDQLGRLPRARDFKSTELCPNSSAIIKHFRKHKYGLPNEEDYGGINKANYMMCEKYGIKNEIEMPESDLKQIKNTGERLSKLGLDTEKLGIEYGPVNEQGVVALFSKIHTLIGFPMMIYITPTSTPDCEATCSIGKAEHNVYIEFKFQTRIYISDESIEKTWNKIHYLVCWVSNNEALKKRLKKTKIISLRDLLSDPKIVSKINNHFSVLGQEPKTNERLHPGEVISMELKARNIKTDDFARMLQLQPGQLNEILKQRQGINEETALKIEAVWGITAEFWMRLQTEYNLAVLRGKGLHKAL